MIDPTALPAGPRVLLRMDSGSGALNLQRRAVARCAGSWAVGRRLLTTDLDGSQLAVTAYSTVLAGASQSGGREQAVSIGPARWASPLMRESGEDQGHEQSQPKDLLSQKLSTSAAPRRNPGARSGGVLRLVQVAHPAMPTMSVAQSKTWSAASAG